MTMQLIDIRLAHAMRDQHLEDANRARHAKAIHRSHLRERVGQGLISLGERLSRSEARVA